VATSLHPGAQGLAAQDRWITWAVLVSLLLHTPLFLSSGTWRRGLLDGTAAPPLLVRIEPSKLPENTQPEGIPVVVEEDAIPSAEPAPAPAIEPSELPLETIDEDTGDTESSLEGWDAVRPDDLSGQLDSMLAEAGPDSLKENPRPELELPSEPVPPADVLVATVAPEEEALLTRQLAREARELLDSSAMQSHLTFDDRHRRFAAVLTRHPAVDDTAIERVAVRVTTEHRGETMQTSMQMKRLTFSHFTQLVDRWDDSVLLHDDEIAGRFHSNSEIHLTYDHKVAPRLLGKVTTARGILFNDQKGWRPRGEIFSGGLETRSGRIRLPDIALPVPHESAPRDSDVHLVRVDALIVFHANGDYECVELASHAEARRPLARDRPTYIIGAPGTELRVRGVVNGNVTVYSPERIVVQDDLTYADGPGRDAAYLGLVSDGNVEIDRAEVTGAGDLAIHAAVYARKRFIVRNAGGPGRATLHIYGSLTAGSLSRTEPRYATRIEFDPRFERVRPPGFPQTDRYEIETWDGRWRLAEAP
jgi:hypothetical protein